MAGQNRFPSAMFVLVLHVGSGRCLGLLAAHQLEVGDLLEGGDDELAVHVVDLELEGVDLDLVLLDLVLHVELGTAIII